MIVYYLDSSAWLKKYFQEDGTAWMVNFFARNEERELACASLGVIEVTATLARKHKSQSIDSRSYQDALEELESDWENFSQIQLTEEIVAEAKTSAKKFALRGADAVHFASALLLREDPLHEDDQIVFIVCDKELKAAAKLAGFTVVDPQEQE
jgi:predicted nucleic acid-binding protein